MSLCEVVFNKDSEFFKGQAVGVRAPGRRGGRGVPVPPCSPAAGAGGDGDRSVLAAGIGVCFLNLHTSGDNLLSWKIRCGLEKGRVCTCVHVPFQNRGL